MLEGQGGAWGVSPWAHKGGGVPPGGAQHLWKGVEGAGKRFAVPTAPSWSPHRELSRMVPITPRLKGLSEIWLPKGQAPSRRLFTIFTQVFLLRDLSLTEPKWKRHAPHSLGQL